MRYGKPTTAAKKIKKGFLEGAGWPFGRVLGDTGERPWNEANAEGVSAVASAGGGRPATLANNVRNHRRRVNMPRIEPRVVRRLENCSATETIASGSVSTCRLEQWTEAQRPTEKA